MSPVGDDVVTLTQDGANASPRISPAGDQIAFIHRYASNGYTYSQVDVMNVDGTQRRTIESSFPGFPFPDPPAVVTNLRWDWSGCALYVATHPGPVGMHPIDQLSLCGGQRSAANFSHFFDVRADGTFVTSYYAPASYHLGLSTFAGAESTFIVPTAEGPVAWSPTGAEVAFEHDGSISLYSQSLQFESAMPIGSRAFSLDNNIDWSPSGFELAYSSSGSIKAVNRSTGLVRTIGPGSQPDWGVVRPMVVLVHGWDLNSESRECTELMDSLKAWLQNKDNTGGVQFQTDCLPYRTREGVYSGAEDLFLRLQRYRRVDLVVHSEGGLVARACIQLIPTCAGRIKSLTMLGTPNYGSVLADVACNFAYTWWISKTGPASLDQGLCDLKPNSAIISILNNPGPNLLGGVAYHVLTGDIGNNILLGFPNDCLVSVTSATGPGFPTQQFPVLHFPVSVGLPSFIGCSFGTGETNDPDVRARVAQILLDENHLSGLPTGAAPFNGAVHADIVPVSPPAASSSTIGLQSGIVHQSQTIDVPIGMPVGQDASTFAFRSPHDPSVSLTFTLRRPGGTPVASGDADATIVTGTGFGGLDETDISIAHPTSGDWIMRVLASAVPSSGWPYDVEAVVPGAISVLATTDAPHYSVGASIDVSASVSIDNVPYGGATAHATVIRPDAATANVPLQAGSPGEYSGAFSDTSTCGLYQIVLVAAGNDNGTAFTRVSRLSVIVGVPGDAVLDPCNGDADGDGLTDADEVETFHTNPAAADTDGDGYSDPRELGLGKNPLQYCDIMRADVNFNADPNLRGNGTINSLDLFAVAKSFGPNRGQIIEDQNNDGNINSLDLLLVARKFGRDVGDCP